MKIDFSQPPEIIEAQFRQMRSIDREIVMGIMHKVQNIDLNIIRQECIQKGQDEGYQLGLKAAKKDIE